MPTVTIYSTPTCGFCHAAKDYFKANDVDFTEHDVTVDEQARNEMVAKTHQMGVPVIDIDGHVVIGFNQPKLAELLGL